MQPQISPTSESTPPPMGHADPSPQGLPDTTSPRMVAPRILPHNYAELLAAQICILRDQPFQLFPDFPAGGHIDISEYDDGHGMLRLRAHITQEDGYLMLRELAPTTQLENVLQSIEAAMARDKIHLAECETLRVEPLEVKLQPAAEAQVGQVLRQLYDHSLCRITIPARLAVRRGIAVVDIGLSEVLEDLTHRLQGRIRRVLELKLRGLEGKRRQLLLRKAFVENQLHRELVEADSIEAVRQIVEKHVEPDSLGLLRDVSAEEIDQLLELPMVELSREQLAEDQDWLDYLLEEIHRTQHQLESIRETTIHYLERLHRRHVGSHPRRSRLELKGGEKSTGFGVH